VIIISLQSIAATGGEGIFEYRVSAERGSLSLLASIGNNEYSWQIDQGNLPALKQAIVDGLPVGLSIHGQVLKLIFSDDSITFWLSDKSFVEFDRSEMLAFFKNLNLDPYKE